MTRNIVLTLAFAALAVTATAETNRTYYARHLGGGRFSSALYDEPATNHYPYISTAPAVTNASVYCRAFRWLVEGETATGIYEITPLPPQPSTNNYAVADLVWWATINGYMTAADALLESNGVYSAAITTRVVSGDNPTFRELWPRLCDALGLTEDERREALDYARTDAEPDALVVEVKQ